jgi:hypothetical protein
MSALPSSASAAENFNRRAAAEKKVMNWSPAGKCLSGKRSLGKFHSGQTISGQKLQGKCHSILLLKILKLHQN